MLIDIHVHTEASNCSRLALQDIMTSAAVLGLDGVCITDHHSVETLDHLQPGIQENGLRLFVGQEYHTGSGDFLIFGPEYTLPENLTAFELLDLVKAAGGAAIAAHPFRRAKPTAESVIRNQWCHIVESINGRNWPRENQEVTTWRNRYDLVECGGSDAHCIEELGRFCTRFHHPIDSTAELIDALNNGHCEPHRHHPFRMVS